MSIIEGVLGKLKDCLWYCRDLVLITSCYKRANSFVRTRRILKCKQTLSVTGRPDMVHNCTTSNTSTNSFSVRCTEGFNGGLPQSFLLEVRESNSQELRANLTSAMPRFSVTHLESGALYQASIYAYNDKGRSEATVVQTGTLRLPEKQLTSESGECANIYSCFLPKSKTNGDADIFAPEPDDIEIYVSVLIHATLCIQVTWYSFDACAKIPARFAVTLTTLKPSTSFERSFDTRFCLKVPRKYWFEGHHSIWCILHEWFSNFLACDKFFTMKGCAIVFWELKIAITKKEVNFSEKQN